MNRAAELLDSLGAMSTTRKEKVLSRDDIEGMIADGRKIFIFNGRVIKADAWLPYHPGGDKAIRHMVGREAGLEIEALHSPEALQRMISYQIGRVDGRWTSMVPPIQGGKFRSKTDIMRGVMRMNDPGISMDEDASSDSSSTEPSPLFEPADRSGANVRQRKYGTHLSMRRSSSSSISSVEMEEPKISPRPAHFDGRTQEEVQLDLAKYPSLDPETQDEIVRKYRLLNERIKAAGLYQCHYSNYAREVSRYLFFFTTSMLLLRWGWYATSGVFLGVFWHQLVFSAHDAGHMGITHDFTTDTVIGIIIADFIGGLSMGWWKSSHNVHHIMTNAPEHDPDTELMPFFAISHRFFESLRSTYYDRVMTYDAFSQFVIRFQHFLYYPILAFGRFNLYVLSWQYLLSSQAPRKGPAWWTRWLEIAGQIFFWIWFGYFVVYRSIPTMWDRLVFVLISHIVTMPLHVQITLSHYAMSTADLGAEESFPQKMLRTTMDVDCPPWLDWVHGGLQFQAIHHLYPRIPRHNLRSAQHLVRDFCTEVDIPYAIFGFVDGNKQVIGRLGDVARQAGMLAACQKALAEQGGHLH